MAAPYSVAQLTCIRRVVLTAIIDGNRRTETNTNRLPTTANQLAKDLIGIVHDASVRRAISFLFREKLIEREWFAVKPWITVYIYRVSDSGREWLEKTAETNVAAAVTLTPPTRPAVNSNADKRTRMITPRPKTLTPKAQSRRAKKAEQTGIKLMSIRKAQAAERARIAAEIKQLQEDRAKREQEREDAREPGSAAHAGWTPPVC